MELKGQWQISSRSRPVPTFPKRERIVGNKISTRTRLSKASVPKDHGWSKDVTLGITFILAYGAILASAQNFTIQPEAPTVFSFRCLLGPGA